MRSEEADVELRPEERVGAQRFDVGHDQPARIGHVAVILLVPKSLLVISSVNGPANKPYLALGFILASLVFCS